MIYKCWLFDYQISTKLWKAYWYVLLRNTYTCNGPKIPITYLSSSDFSLSLSVLSVFFLKFQPDRKKVWMRLLDVPSKPSTYLQLFLPCQFNQKSEKRMSLQHNLCLDSIIQDKSVCCTVNVRDRLGLAQIFLPALPCWVYVVNFGYWRRAAVVPSVGRHQELPPCLAEPIPARGVGITSVITYLRKGKKNAVQQQLEREKQSYRHAGQ